MGVQADGKIARHESSFGDCILLRGKRVRASHDGEMYDENSSIFRRDGVVVVQRDEIGRGYSLHARRVLFRKCKETMFESNGGHICCVSRQRRVIVRLPNLDRDYYQRRGTREEERRAAAVRVRQTDARVRASRHRFRRKIQIRANHSSPTTVNKEKRKRRSCYNDAVV